jgi:2-polyprenyl-6-methoxyphenol hydroxylase-like FAD-dependent oxidoreductase
VGGLAAALGVARAGHRAVVLERDEIGPSEDPEAAFRFARRGIPHYLQPHAFLPRGRRVLRDLAPDVLEALLEAGAEAQDLASRLTGPPEEGDEDLVYLWIRRPLIEWALRRAAAAEPGVELRAGTSVAALLTDEKGTHATGVGLKGGDVVHGDLVVDALGRYRPPPAWPRPEGTEADCGAVYYCRYFRLAYGVEHLDGGPRNPLNPRGDLGYMGFNTFRGDNRTFAVILLAPKHDRELRVLKDERAWMEACAAMRPLDVMTSADYGRPVTGVMPMGGLMNVDRTHPGIRGVLPMGDAFCHTDPAFAYGLSFALAHGEAIGRVARGASDPAEVFDGYFEEVTPEARERYRLACEMDEARTRAWQGDAVDPTRRDGCYPLFSFVTALVASPHDDEVLRRTIRRVGLLDRTRSFDEDEGLHRRIEEIVERLAQEHPPTPAGPPRTELLARLAPAAAR